MRPAPAHVGRTSHRGARRSASAPFVSAGMLTIGGSYVGQPEGPPEPIVLEPGGTNQYEGFFGPPFLYPLGRSVRVNVEDTGSEAAPPLPPIDLWSAPTESIEVVHPSFPAGSGVVSSKWPLVVQWRPLAPNPSVGRDPKVIVALLFIAGQSLTGEVRCG